MSIVNNFLNLGGWDYSSKEIKRIQAMQPCKTIKAAQSMFSIVPKAKTTLLYQYLVEMIGSYPVRLQEIGDCVSHGMAGAVDVLLGVQNKLGTSLERWVSETASEVIYALSRVEIGNRQLGNDDGSYGGWAAEAVKRYGTLCRQSYGNIDLTNYSGQRAKDWGYKGCPDELEPIAKQHTVNTISRVTTSEELITAITNGYPVTLACNVGFRTSRDKNGFSHPEGNWAHQQFIHGYRTDIEGFCIQNSWGPNWISGPKALEQPDGSYWVTKKVMDWILKQDVELWAISNFNGYKPQELSWRII